MKDCSQLKLFVLYVVEKNGGLDEGCERVKFDSVNGSTLCMVRDMPHSHTLEGTLILLSSSHTSPCKVKLLLQKIRE